LVLYNINTDYSAPVLFGPGSRDVLDGNYSVGVSIGNSIRQTGLIPADAVSLLFLGPRPGWVVYSVQVSINGQNLPYKGISVSTDSTLWGADISAFAGQTATLTFSGFGLFDDIQFSPELIPEPSFSWLPFLGSGVLLYLYKHKKQSTPE